MKLQDKVAFVTGAASGIGLGIARALAARGVRVMLADLDGPGVEAAAAGLDGAAATVCDVADIAAVRAAARATLDRFGRVDILVNNAGVSFGAEVGATALADWRWIVDVNLMGVVHGVETFVPLIKAHGQGGHIVNTASMTGFWAGLPGLSPYAATKFAVVGYAEAIRAELADHRIGVSVLAPGWVRTRIHQSHARRAGAADHEVPAVAETIGALVEGGIDPQVVGDWTADCIAAGRGYIFTDPHMRSLLDLRHQMIQADYDACARDPRFAL